MLKSFVILAVCLTGVLGQVGPLDNSVELDREGTFRLDWSILADGTGNPNIVFQTRVQTQGWISIRFSDGVLGDFFWAAYDADSPRNSFHRDMWCTLKDGGDSCRSPQGPSLDQVNDYTLFAEGYDFLTNTTVHRFQRRQNTFDAQDFAIPTGPIEMGWAWSDGITINNGLTVTPITKRGATMVTLIPAKE